MTFSFKKSVQGICTLSAVGAAVLSVSGCGGGGDLYDTSPPTIRPKTLDALILYLDGSVTFEFLRNTGTPPALKSGNVEVGTFIYNRGGNEIRQHPNQGGDTSDTQYPDKLNSVTYSYLAVNETSAVLTMDGIVDNDLTTSGGGFDADNGSYTFLFQSDSAGNPISQVQVDLTFSTDGSAITPDVATVRIPGSAMPWFDVIFVPAGLTTDTGGPVLENYNPQVDPNAPSKIAPPSLDNLTIVFTNGTDPTYNFNIQFVTQATFPNKTNATDPDETGQGLMTVNGNPLVGAMTYSWRRINGTDTGVLVIGGINPPDPVTLNGSYVLDFLGLDNGPYNGSLDGNTTDINEVTGTFFVGSGLP